MTNEKHAPNEPMPLNDDELSQVSGGYGSWDETCEHDYQEKRGLAAGEIEGYLVSRDRQDDAIARKSWLKSKSRDSEIWFYEDGETWSRTIRK